MHALYILMWFVIFSSTNVLCFGKVTLVPANHFDHSGKQVGMDQDRHLWAIYESA